MTDLSERFLTGSHQRALSFIRGPKLLLVVFQVLRVLNMLVKPKFKVKGHFFLVFEYKIVQFIVFKSREAKAAISGDIVFFKFLVFVDDS